MPMPPPIPLAAEREPSKMNEEQEYPIHEHHISETPVNAPSEINQIISEEILQAMIAIDESEEAKIEWLAK